MSKINLTCTLVGCAGLVRIVCKLIEKVVTLQITTKNTISLDKALNIGSARSTAHAAFRYVVKSSDTGCDNSTKKEN